MKTAIITGASSGLGREFARQLTDIFPEIECCWLIARREDRLEEILERPLDSEIHPFNPDKIKLTAGSTDVGDVGYAAPTLNINIATACIGNVGHSWQMVAQTCSPLAHKGLLTAAKVMALACVRTMDRPDVIEAAKKELKKRNGGHYTCPLPDSVMPPLDTY